MTQQIKEWWWKYLDGDPHTGEHWIPDGEPLERLLVESTRLAKLSAYEHLLKTASGAGSWRRVCEQEIEGLKKEV